MIKTVPAPRIAHHPGGGARLILVRANSPRCEVVPMKRLPRLVIAVFLLLAGWAAAPPNFAPSPGRRRRTSRRRRRRRRRSRSPSSRRRSAPCWSRSATPATRPTAEKIRGGLMLDTREGMRKGGDSGPAVVPGDPKRSLLHQGDPATRTRSSRCRPRRSCPTTVIADFEKWVAMARPTRATATPPASRRRDRHREGPQVLGVPAAEEAGRPRR